MRENGYKTAIFGKFPRAKLSKSLEDPSNFGFDTYIIENGGLPTYDAPCFCQKRKLQKQCFFGHHKNALYVNKEGKTQPKLVCTMTQSPDDAPYELPRGKMDSEILTDMFESYLSNMTEDQPFYVQIAYRSVHAPYIASPTLRDSCTNDFTEESVCGNPKPKSSKQIDYAGNVASVDNSVGRIRTMLKHYRPTSWENTIVFFLSDNGPEVHEFDGAGSAGKLKGMKRSLNEGGIRVPGLFEWPAMIRSNRISQEIVSILDIPVTAMTLVEMEQGSEKTLDSDGQLLHERDGVSLLSLIVDSNAAVRNKPLNICRYIDFINVEEGVVCPEVATITKRWKTISTRSQTSVELTPNEYYDLMKDPREEYNVRRKFKKQDAFIYNYQNAKSWIRSVFFIEGKNQLKKCF